MFYLIHSTYTKVKLIHGFVSLTIQKRALASVRRFVRFKTQVLRLRTEPCRA